MSSINSSETDSDVYSNESIDNREGIEITPKDFFNSKELCYYTIADKFFKTKCTQYYIDLMIDIINSESDISLRVLDWFAAKHSKNRDKLNFDYGATEFDVRISYDSQLRTFRKKYFDPFRRKKKFFYYYDKNDKSKKILTTIGQLNFFKWAIRKKILEFVKDHLNDINKEMTVSNIKDKKNKIKLKESKKNQKINPKKNKNIVNTKKIDDVEMILTFT